MANFHTNLKISFQSIERALQVGQLTLYKFLINSSILFTYNENMCFDKKK